MRHSGPLTEDLPVLLTAPHPIPRSKKIAELLGEQLAEATGTEVVSLRISGTLGPLGHEGPFLAAPGLIHATASGKPLDLSGLLIPPHLGDGLDLCYVKDTGRAIALVQRAGHLQHRTYSIASGRVTANAEVIAAIREAVPDAALGLPAGARRPGAALDITRLRQDTGFEPEYDTVRAAASYIAWLRAGNER
jgi:UDP-glucose 4-epimerase